MVKMLQLKTLPPLIAAFIVIEECLRTALGHIRRKRKRTAHSSATQGAQGAYGGLESLVSFSACLIAANRAVETEQADPYIIDPLAAGLCGREALEARRARDNPPPAGGQAVAPNPPSAAVPGSQPERPQQLEAQKEALQRRPIQRLIMRTKFFDDVAAVVTWRGAGAGAEPSRPSCHAALLEAVRGIETPCLQVVLLGSGLDSRPWRLPLPPGVRWFEVDRRDVLAAKQARLRALGAQTDAAQPCLSPDAGRLQLLPQAQDGNGASAGPSRSAGNSSGAHAVTAAGSSSGGGGGGVDGAGKGGAGGDWPHPLHVAQWSCCAADLTCRGWSRGLQERGLDAHSPVLWVLEGLLYYLEEADVRALLQEAASLSAPGSILAASVIRTAPDGSAARGGSGAGAGGAAHAGDGSGGAAAGGKMSYNLSSEFKWRCQGEISKFFGDCGWRTLVAASWLDAAKAYCFPPADSAASSVYFVTAARA